MTNNKIDCKIQISDSKIYFTTQEKAFKCPRCKQIYHLKRYCLQCKKRQFKIQTMPTVIEHTGWINRNDINDYSCDCIFSSWFMWAKFWQKKTPKSKCKHYKWALKKCNR